MLLTVHFVQVAKKKNLQKGRVLYRRPSIQESHLSSQFVIVALHAGIVMLGACEACRIQTWAVCLPKQTRQHYITSR